MLEYTGFAAADHSAARLGTGHALPSAGKDLEIEVYRPCGMFEWTSLLTSLTTLATVHKQY